jgi:hypothetical protein
VTKNARLLARGVLAALAITLPAACSSVSAVRLQPDAVDVGPGLRPVAGIQAHATSAYVLFIPLPGGADLDHVVNQKLVTTARAMGADKIIDLQFETTPEHGIWTLRRLLGWRTARASGIAVQVVDLPPAPDAGMGSESPSAPPSP